VYQRLVISVSYTELISNGWLVPCDVAKPSLTRREQRALKQRPDGVHAYLTEAKRADGIWRPGVHFESTIALCQEATDRYNASGVRAALICLDTSTEERRRLFDLYTIGHLDMLCSPQALSEGFDSPRAEVCVLRRSAGHVGFYLQVCGRVLRAYGPNQIAQMLELALCLGLEPDPGALRPKERALLLDLTDARSIHGLPTADRKYSLEGTAIELDEQDEPLPEPTDDPDEPRGQIELTAVEAKYERIRDDLRDRMRELQTLAVTRGYKPGYVYAAFREATGIVLPNLVKLAKKRATCKHCKVMAELGTEMLGKRNPHNPGWSFWHPDCWFSTLSENELERRTNEYDYLDNEAPHDWRGQMISEAAQ
jgi:superfamily II DNA or RNA helicase